MTDVVLGYVLFTAYGVAVFAICAVALYCERRHHLRADHRKKARHAVLLTSSQSPIGAQRAVTILTPHRPKRAIPEQKPISD